MIARSPLIASLSLCCALAVHAAFLVEIEDDTVEIEGGGNVAPAALGSSFTDLVQGTATAVEADTARETTPVDHIAPTPPAEADASQVEPVTAAARVPERTQTQTAPTSVSEVVPVAVTPVAAAAPVQRAFTEAPPEPVGPVEKPSELAPSESVRPATRPSETAVAQGRAQPRKPAPAAPRGNSSVNARAGAASGAEVERATQAASTRSAPGSGAGNAAASNYPGVVMRKIHRMRKPRTSVRGVARVTFVIGSNGQLSTLRISNSSGSSELDQIALRQIRKAAPFPPPPTGARTQYSIAITGR